ncbi:sugar nucleotide-binding protein [Klebsiella pneumoniae]|nr:sugar nucleotide-binding protein [Klebsiella pneumoniae]
MEQGNPRHLIFRTSWVYATRGANLPKRCSARRVRKRRFHH